MLSKQDKILFNTQLAVNNSIYIPIIIGCSICSSILFQLNNSISNLIVGSIWLITGIVALYYLLKYDKKIRSVVE